jgi:hypothetical protein
LHAPVFSPGNSAPVAVEVAGSAAVDVSFRLPPTPPSPTPVYRISGKIIFGGRANPGPFGPGGERVFLFRGKDCGPRNNAQPAAYGTAGVDAYEIRNVPPGAYAACFMRGSDVIIGTGWYGPFNLEVADKDITVDFDLTQPDKRGLPNPPARGARG